VVGLLLGGALTDYLNWRWVLFVNVPIAIGLLIGTGVLIEGERDRGKIDLPGAITATLGLGSLVFAINRTNVHGWGDGLTVTCLIASAVLLTSFLLIQRGSAVAMMPPRVFRNRGRIGANVVMFLVGAGMFATFYFLTLYMQDVKGYTPMECGLAYLPFAVGIVIAAGGIGPQLLARMSERAVILLGLAIAAAGMAWFGVLTPDQNLFAALLPAQLVAGIGLGLTFVTVTIVAVRGVELRDTGIASGLVNTSQQIGGALGLAGLVAVALAVMNGAAPGTAHPEVLTNGYTAGLMIAGGLYLVALVVGALTISGSAPNTADAADVPAGGPTAR
jgi:predicted MFS family arabinose efflux permease